MPRVSHMVRVLAAFACVPLGTSLMNARLFPLFDTVFPFARDLGELAGALVAAIVALVAVRRPVLLRPRGFTVAALALWALGTALVFWGLEAASVGALVAGNVASKAGGAWLCAVILVAAGAVFDGRWMMAAVPAALGAGCLLAWAVGLCAGWAPLAVYALAQPVGALIAYPVARPAVRDTAAAPAADDMALTWPSSYLPLGNRLFVCIFVFSIATGFAQRFGAQEGRVESMPFAIAAFAACVGYCLVRSRPRRFDVLFDVAVFFTMGGFLLVPLPSAVAFSTGALSIGDACYQVLYNLVLFSLAARNRLANLSVVSWGWAWSVFGIVLGANVGAVVQANIDVETAYFGSVAMALVLLAYVLFGLRDFSFDATIEGVVPVRPLLVREGDAASSIDAACHVLADAHGLTSRETDILLLLARGRNNSYIQEELSLTRNTVKSHIKHVYAKLDVHSQQELIDLVCGG